MSRRFLALTAVCVLAVSLGLTAQESAEAPSWLLIDATTGRVLDGQWTEPDRPRPVGSLIKPFTALAYADTHGFAYPTFVCRGAADGCWLPAGHGRVGLADAVAGSCNAYFRLLAQRASPDAFVATLQRFGMRTDEAIVTPAGMVGFGDGVKLAPSALMRAYLELVARRSQPGVAAIVQGMRASARTGTGRAVGAAIGQTDALVKTGTAPCSHAHQFHAGGHAEQVQAGSHARAADTTVEVRTASHAERGRAEQTGVPAPFVPSNGDGFTLVIYPADRPRIVLLVQAHGHTGAETAAIAGPLLVRLSQIR